MKPEKTYKNVIPQLFGYDPQEKPPLIHFIGIGGIGMSSLSQWFLAQKWAVSGSDIAESKMSREIEKIGIKVKIGHKKSNIAPGIKLIVFSQAIGPTNPELREAKRRNIPVFSYPELVGHLTRIYKTIAVAGSHGKSTTTALLGIVLAHVDADPTVIIGTALTEFGGKNFRFGKGAYLLLEADEYKAAFLRYSPTLAVVTNIDREHLDFYKNLRNVQKHFLKFLSRVKNGGIFVLNRDDKNLFSLRLQIETIAKSKNIQACWYSLKQPESKKIKQVLKIPGEHNVSNALAALTAAAALRIPISQILRAIGKYEGAWRRMEYRGKYGGALVFDDYAHHPTEVAATLKGFREKYPKKEIVCVFQPHQAERLRMLFKEFQTAFDGADETLILPVYRVAGRDRTRPKFDSKALVRKIQRRQPKKLVFYLEKIENLKKAINTLDGALDSKIIVMMGAGNIADYTNPLLAGWNKK